MARSYARRVARRAAREAARKAVSRARHQSYLIFRESPLEELSDVSDKSHVSGISSVCDGYSGESSGSNESGSVSQVSRTFEDDSFGDESLDDFEDLPPLQILCRRFFRDNFSIDQISLLPPACFQFLAFPNL